MVRTLHLHCIGGGGVGVGLILGGELEFQKSHGTIKKRPTLLCFYKLTMNYQREIKKIISFIIVSKTILVPKSKSNQGGKYLENYRNFDKFKMT